MKMYQYFFQKVGCFEEKRKGSKAKGRSGTDLLICCPPPVIIAGTEDTYKLFVPFIIPDSQK
jgi:hypothetical protein